jgi:hypothetical protein
MTTAGAVGGESRVGSAVGAGGVPRHRGGHEPERTRGRRPSRPQGRADAGPHDPTTALLALHWAWAVVGPPGTRRPYPWRDAFLDVRPTAFLTDIYDGDPRNDVRTYVRRDARRVEAAYLPFLESLDT